MIIKGTERVDPLFENCSLGKVKEFDPRVFERPEGKTQEWAKKTILFSLPLITHAKLAELLEGYKSNTFFFYHAVN